MQQVFKRGSVCVSILDKKEEEEDSELDKTIAQLGIAEYQVKKVRRILAGILDRSNPVAFSKGSSTYTFESEDREYRITFAVDVFDRGDKSSTTTTTAPAIRSFRNALKSPAFVITCTLFSAVIGVLALVSLYWTSPVLGTFSDRQLDTLDRQYSQILDRCAAIIHDDQPYNPRSFGAHYSICNKAIVQLQEFCKLHHISTCEDERMMDVYLGGDKART